MDKSELQTNKIVNPISGQFEMILIALRNILTSAELLRTQIGSSRRRRFGYTSTGMAIWKASICKSAFDVTLVMKKFI